ncbi:hypothetical protein [Clostridium cellulovorans]|uniref:hypothetical protein n=1 Tax=Clostridium cellulovorans TaxID=1493 RepID=UPI0012F769F5|nr:hypothetical protein [Clostridium cellulovorans]
MDYKSNMDCKSNVNWKFKRDYKSNLNCKMKIHAIRLVSSRINIVCIDKGCIDFSFTNSNARRLINVNGWSSFV